MYSRSGVAVSGMFLCLTVQMFGLWSATVAFPDPEVIKLQYSLKLKIKSNDWLLADTCRQAANHCALF